MTVLAQSFWIGQMLRCGGCGCLALVLKGDGPVRTVEGEDGVATAIFACPVCAQPVAIDRDAEGHSA